MRPLPKDIVRRGYDALSYRYRGDDEVPEHYATWLAQLRQRVRAGGSVLDLGCGCGVPLARDLAGGGYAVTAPTPCSGPVRLRRGTTVHHDPVAAGGVLRERVAQ